MDNKTETEILEIASVAIKGSTIVQACGLFAAAAVIAIIKGGLSK